MSLTTVTTARRENKECTIVSSWTQQLTKTVAVTATSIGFGWFMNHLWGASPQTQPSSESPLAHRGALVARETPFLGVSQASFNQSSCIAEIVAGSLGSVITANPLPLAIGALSCIPAVAATSPPSCPSSVQAENSNCDTSQLAKSRIKLSEFAPEAAEFLKSFYTNGAEFYRNIPLRFLMGYEINGDEVIFHPNLGTAANFKETLQSALDEATVFNIDKVKSNVFGKASWARYLGNIGDISMLPLLPENIDALLDSPCPFWTGKTVKETHLLTLVPQTVNGELLTYDHLRKLAEKPIQGHAINIPYPGCWDLRKRSDLTLPSHWALITRDVIPNSFSKRYIEQLAMINQYPFYKVPLALDIIISIFAEFTRSGVHLYSDTGNCNMPCTWKKKGDCEEKSTCTYTNAPLKYGESEWRPIGRFVTERMMDGKPLGIDGQFNYVIAQNIDCGLPWSDDDVVKSWGMSAMRQL